MTLAVDLIKKHEGFSGLPYTDTEGHLTIGYGTRLPLDKREAELLLRARMTESRDELRILFRNYDLLDETRQAVLADMHYNLGFGGLRKFVKFIDAVVRYDFDTAAREMLNSKWASQVKTRAVTLAALMKTGVVVDAEL